MDCIESLANLQIRLVQSNFPSSVAFDSSLARTPHLTILTLRFGVPDLLPQCGIPDDSLWQGYHRRLQTVSSQLYTCPGKGAGKDFINQLCEEFSGFTERKWNSERSLVFCLAMLQKKPGIIQSCDIQKCLKHRLEEWKANKHKALVKTTERLMQADVMSSSQGRTTQEERLKKYNQLKLLVNPRQDAFLLRFSPPPLGLPLKCDVCCERTNMKR
jgi:hypothetical protein